MPFDITELTAANILFADDEVVLSSYEGSSSGMIQSFIDRYSDDDYCKILQELWQKDSPHFTWAVVTITPSRRGLFSGHQDSYL